MSAIVLPVPPSGDLATCRAFDTICRECGWGGGSSRRRETAERRRTAHDLQKHPELEQESEVPDAG